MTPIDAAGEGKRGRNAMSYASLSLAFPMREKDVLDRRKRKMADPPRLYSGACAEGEEPEAKGGKGGKGWGGKEKKERGESHPPVPHPPKKRVKPLHACHLTGTVALGKGLREGKIKRIYDPRVPRWAVAGAKKRVDGIRLCPRKPVGGKGQKGKEGLPGCSSCRREKRAGASPRLETAFY